MGRVTSTTVIRATPDHAAVVGRMLADFNAEFDTPGPSAAEFAGRLRRLLAGDDLAVFLGEGDAGPTGFSLVTLRLTHFFDGPLAQLEELYVRPALRDRGIGSALLQATIAFVRGRGGEEMHINVDEVDVDARRFYERHGFLNTEPGADHRMLCYIGELTR